MESVAVAWVAVESVAVAWVAVESEVAALVAAALVEVATEVTAQT